MDDLIRSTKFSDVFRHIKEIEWRSIEQEVESPFVDLKLAYSKDNGIGLEPALNDNFKKASKRFRPVKPERYFFLEDARSNDPINRWKEYKRRAKQNYHCDGSKTSRVVPNATNTFYERYKELDEGKDRHVASGDTMNSMQTIYNQAVKLNVADELEFKQQLQLLARLSQTIGNFIPCSAMFNGKRYAPTKDYWDITLIYIKHWFLRDKDEAVNSEEREHIESTTFFTEGLEASADWLGSYGEGQNGWNCFIEKNLLEMYVNGKDKNGTYSIRKFYKAHGPKNLNPKDKKQLLKCLCNMNACIILRGNVLNDRGVTIFH